MNILKVTDPAFQAYGKVVEGMDVSELLTALKEVPQPDDVIYVASDSKLEACGCCEEIGNSLFGGMPIQIGYCSGSNYLLNAVEYHRDSEVNVALTDLILILGKEQDIEEDFTYDTSKMEAFSYLREPWWKSMPQHCTMRRAMPMKTSSALPLCCQKEPIQKHRKPREIHLRISCFLQETNGSLPIKRQTLRVLLKA